MPLEYTTGTDKVRLCNAYCIEKSSSSIGLYRENAIAIESEANDSFGGNVYYVTMQITLPIPKFTHNERSVHCDALHITPDRVVRLFVDDAIAAFQTSL